MISAICFGILLILLLCYLTKIGIDEELKGDRKTKGDK